MSGTEKRVIVYTDEHLAQLGHRLRKLREQEVALKREIGELEAQQTAYAKTLSPVVDAESDAMQKRFFRIFNAALAGTDPVVLATVYEVCLGHRNLMQSWRSPYGEQVWVAYQRRMDEIGGTGIVDDLVKAAEPTFTRWSIIACGDRNWPWAKRNIIQARFAKFNPDTTRLIHGGNGYRDPDGKLRKGADMICDAMAKRLGWAPAKVFPYIGALGAAGGPVRNKQMLDELIRRRDEHGEQIMVVAFHPNLAESKGTLDMVSIAMKAGVPFEIISGA